MKYKRIVLLLIITVVIIPIISAANYPKGDVDGDGKVSVLDYVLIRKHLLNTSKLTGDKLTRADVNSDGKVSVNDYIAIRKIILGQSVDQNIVVTGVGLNKTETTIYVGESLSLSAIITPSNATNKTVTWSSTKPEVATVSNGKITAKSVGRTSIIVTTKDGSKTAKCTVTVQKKVAVTEVTLNKSNATLKVGESITLKATVKPSDATNKTITWSSSDSNVASVDNGKVTVKKTGRVEITAKTSNNKAATFILYSPSNPKKPSSSSYSYESDTFKYYIKKTNDGFFLAYIWMKDPYLQTKKLEANTATYGRIITDDELNKGVTSSTDLIKYNDKKLHTLPVPNMVNKYVEKSLIKKSDTVLAFNGSNFKYSGSWEPEIPYYHKRTGSWLVLNEGKVTRYYPDDGVKKWGSSAMVGIDRNGNLKFYKNIAGQNSKGNKEPYIEKRKELYNTIKEVDGLRNTWSFSPPLIENGKIIKNDSEYYNKNSSQRLGICQLDSNNYIMLETKTGVNVTERRVAEIFLSLGCKTAFNLDGGGSTSLVYKKKNSSTATTIKCSDKKTHEDGSVTYDRCRSIVEGMYFTELG